MNYRDSWHENPCTRCGSPPGVSCAHDDGHDDETAVKARIQLIVRHPDGHCSNVEIIGASVTPTMLEAAEDLIHTLSSDERTLPNGLYDVIAIAFATTREDAKARLLRALYSKKDAP